MISLTGRNRLDADAYLVAADEMEDNAITPEMFDAAQETRLKGRLMEVVAKLLLQRTDAFPGWIVPIMGNTTLEAELPPLKIQANCRERLVYLNVYREGCMRPALKGSKDMVLRHWQLILKRRKLLNHGYLEQRLVELFRRKHGLFRA